MSTVKIATALCTDLLAALAGNDYVALMLADPFSVTDPLTVEVAGYSRSIVEWDIAERTIAAVDDLLFAGVPSGITPVALAGFDEAYNGTMAWALLLEEADQLTTSSYGNLVVPAEQVVLGFAAL